MKLRLKAVWNIAEVIVTVIVQLLIFRIIIIHLGIAALGIWSLVFSALSVARVADVGVAGALVRFVARPATESSSGIAPLVYVETAFLTNLGLYLVLAAAAYLPVYQALGWATQGSALAEARQLLPYALFAFVIANLSAVSASSLVAFNRSDLKSILAIATLLVQLVVSLVAVRRYGLPGLAVAQIAQNVLRAVIGWFASVRVAGVRSRWALPIHLNVLALKEMFGFGVRFQLLNIGALLYDPVTKFTFSAVAGPAALGLYEAAYRLVFQARAIIVAPSQNLPPMFAAMGAEAIEERRTLYYKSTAIMTLAGVLGVLGALVVSPAVSLLLLGKLNPIYVVWVAVLSLGWFSNIAGAPGYLMGIGCGWLRWNIVAAAFETLASGAIGYLLGTMFGASGVTVAAAASIFVGGVIAAVGNCRIAGIPHTIPRLGYYIDAAHEIWYNLVAITSKLRALPQRVTR